METKVNYVLVGLFVLVLTAAAIVAGLWLASDLGVTRYRPYLAYFHESVAGLNPSAAVKYRGVDVGLVRALSLDPADPTRVQVRLDIADGTPVRTDTYAILKFQGLTGIAFVELEGGAHGRPLASPLPDGSPAVIPTRPSPAGRLDEAVSRAAARIDQLGARLAAVLDQENIQALHHILANLEEVTATLARNRENLDRLLTETARFSRDLAAAGESLPQLGRQLNRLLTDYDRLAAQLIQAATVVTRLGRQLERTSAATGRDLHQALLTLEAEIQRLSLEVGASARELRRLSRRLSQHPNALIYGSPQPPPGPGE
ncbi:phospholipid/cholesterol/gamma-HCH transport system substrate-binding protein [Methylomarinovum caldicuralii]|uniref:Phospholipid/cholesterol/gamma-HCH transport system substrate-binding protein n=1 Tax=Methylomarinovum caldicuralii TaxID=438856 RepID=A0AAU9BZG9_9GAMM|nr:MlaD family protein [Methylomarinovum caldicuralii]BCX81760.1 phospholipid/cholesterol/gamma-HCH transport system substrate-binding protein [Methylomarinovum caldicuralii]